MIFKISESSEVDQTSRIEKIIANFKQRAKVSSYLLTVQLSNINHINLEQKEGYRLQNNSRLYISTLTIILETLRVTEGGNIIDSYISFS